ncbi:hypothetical protein ACVDG8_002390 [Mesorhizobium sp. ORM8.1]
MSDLIPAKEALARCGYKHRNSLPALIEKLGVQPVVRNGRNYFRLADVNAYLAGTAPKSELTPEQQRQADAFNNPQPTPAFKWPEPGDPADEWWALSL